MPESTSTSRATRSGLAFALIAAIVAWSAPAGAVTAASSTDCGGVVFADLDADGRRTEALERDQQTDDVEPGVGGVAVRVVDASGREHDAVTGVAGRWHLELTARDYPIRVEFDLADGFEPGRPGPDGGTRIQYIADPSACASAGDLGVFHVDSFCASNPEIAVPCYVSIDHPDFDDRPAIHAVSNASVDDATTDADSIDDWLRPAARTIATHGEVGAVHGLATLRDGTVFAAAFTKRHTTLRTPLNPGGNPTVVYRIPAGGSAERFVTIDLTASDPHRHAGDPHDLTAMPAVGASGLGDIEISPDESTLYTVDLGRRELVEVSVADARIVARWRLTGHQLGRDDCNVSDEQPLGDLRASGLGWRDDTLLIGVVCTAESTVVDGVAVREIGEPGPGAGDHGQLHAYVYGFDGDRFVELLEWPLAAGRGETQNNGLRSNEATWHPWVDAYPFDAEHDVVSYPQPMVTDLAVDRRGGLVVALGDRWSHQTGPVSVAPAWDGDTRRITETVSAGDLQRACRRGEYWVIEGAPGCPGGFGNGWEFFDGDSYGWHAETALGSVLRLPGRAEVVATQMDPVSEDGTWRSGGIAWHSTEDGTYADGVRLYDGRSADPEDSNRKALGVGDLALLCGGPDRSLGGAIWHDRDADGVRAPSDPPVPGVAVELRDPDGAVLSIDTTDERGRYTFDAENVATGLVVGVDYTVVLAPRNFVAGRGALAGATPATGLVPTLADAGDHDDLDSDAVQMEAQGAIVHGFAHRFAADPSAAIDHSRDIGLRDRYDLSVSTSPGERMRDEGVVAFRIEVENQGSVPSGPFELRANLPTATSMRSSGAAPSVAVTADDEHVAWSFGVGDEIPPGGSRAIEMVLQINDPTLTAITHRVEVIADGGDDEDSTPAQRLGEDDEDSMTVELFGLAGAVWIGESEADAEGEQIQRAAKGVVVHVVDGDGRRLGGATTDESGRYLFDGFPAGSYRISIPAAEFEPGGPLHGYGTAVGADSADVAAMLAADDAVWSAVVRLGDDMQPGGVAESGLGLVREPPRPLIDLVVMMGLVPLSAVCVVWLLADRRRNRGAPLIARDRT